MHDETASALAEPGPEPDVRREGRRRRRRRGSRPARRPASRIRQRIRLTHFLLATLWGFTAGTAGVLVGLTASGRPPGLDGPIAAALGVAVLVALGGGGVASRAYREASQRFR